MHDASARGPFPAAVGPLSYSLLASASRAKAFMTTLLLTHRSSLDHLTPPGHPERPDRIRAVDEVLAEARFDALVRGEAPEGSLDLVTLCHNEHYVDELRHVAPKKGLIYLDGDTSMSPGTWEAVMRGVGGAVAATD